MNLPQIIQCVDRDNFKPVSAVIVFNIAGIETRTKTSDTGNFLVPPECDEDSFAIIRSIEGHWSAQLSFKDLPAGDYLKFYLVPLDIEQDAFWWRQLFDQNISHSCDDIHIGIVDLGFQHQTMLSNFNMMDAEGRELEIMGFPSETHGYFVSQVFTAWHQTGAMSKATYSFIDVSQHDAKGLEIDPLSVLAAIVTLREDLRVDLINVSAGYDPKQFEGSPYETDANNFNELLRHEIRLCSGLIVAAVGNEEQAAVKAPACFDEVVGVTGVATTRATVQQTRLEQWQNEALATKTIGHNIHGDHFFHIKGLTYGKQVDVAAPGAGLWMQGVDNRPVEMEGTSFAAPIVTSALACAIARRQENDINFGLSKDLLKEICVNVGLEREKQGLGVPLKL